MKKKLRITQKAGIALFTGFVKGTLEIIAYPDRIIYTYEPKNYPGNIRRVYTNIVNVYDEKNMYQYHSARAIEVLSDGTIRLLGKQQISRDFELNITEFIP